MQNHVDERVRGIFTNLVDVPSLPEAVQTFVKLSEKNSSPREFADLIALDQGLASKVLRLVNSAFYSLREPVASLRQACTLLGTNTLKSLVLSVSVKNLLNDSCSGFDAVALWKHSVATAVASQRLAAILLPSLVEELYVGGLLHDVGVTPLRQHLGNDYATVLRSATVGRRCLAEVEQETFGVSHAEVGRAMALRWRLPAVVVDCIGGHEEKSETESSVIAETTKAVDILRYADTWSQTRGLDFPCRDAHVAEVDLELPAWVEQEPAEIDAALSEVEADLVEWERLLFEKNRIACGC
jgi:HD-like signal output (HDOD) protein